MPYDVKRELKDLYAPTNTTWALIDVPEQQFIAIDGHGNPNTSDDYTRAVEALYAVAYTVKFASKRIGSDLVVAPLEGLWWSLRMTRLHHEIYLGHPRKIDPAKLKTVLRQPVRPAVR